MNMEPIVEESVADARSSMLRLAVSLVGIGSRLFATGKFETIDAAVSCAQAQVLGLMQDAELAELATELLPHSEEREPVLQALLVNRP